MIANGGYTWGLTNYLSQEAWCALNYAEQVENPNQPQEPAAPEEPEVPAQPAASVSLSREGAILTPGDSMQLSASVSPEEAGSPTWSSTNEDVAICANGQIIATAAGDAEITATLPTGETAVCRLTVLASATQVGDVDGDGRSSVSDIVTLRGIILGSVHLSDGARVVADIDGDGKLVVSDIIAARALILA